MPKKLGHLSKLGTLYKYIIIIYLSLIGCQDAKVLCCVVLFEKIKDAKHQKCLDTCPRKFGTLQLFQLKNICLYQLFILSGPVQRIGYIVQFLPQEREKIDVLSDVIECDIR